MYVVVCADLTPSQQAVQSCHACIAAGRDLVQCDSPNLVLVTVPDEKALEAISGCLDLAGIRHRVFVEEDLGDRATALATEPIEQSQRKHFRDLPLYGREIVAA